LTNGGEFINRRLKDRCDLNHIRFTRGRPYRKNDNCFVEQKNGDGVRKTVYYHRFEGQEMYDALEKVYRHLNPLLNYRYPTLPLVAKEKQASGGYKKICEKVPKTPCWRLLESPDLAEAYKAELRRRALLFNPVTLKLKQDRVVTLEMLGQFGLDLIGKIRGFKELHIRTLRRRSVNRPVMRRRGVPHQYCFYGV
jgi:hypothetical protein